MFLTMKYGAYTFGIVLLLAFMLQFVGISSSLLQNLIFLILGAEMYFCCQEYKHRTQEPLSYGQAFGISWQVSSYAGFIMGIFIFLVIQLVGADEMVKQAMKNKELFVVQTGDKPEDVEAMIKSIFSPWSLFFILVLLHIVVGFFLSILIAFLARTPQMPPQNEI